MPIVRAQAVFNGSSGLPEDTFVNTFHFNANALDTGGIENIATNVATVLNSFYGKRPGLAGDTAALSSVAEYLSQAHRGGTFKIYDLSVPEGQRVPTERPMAFVNNSNNLATSLPFEVAACLSYFATINRPRTRGRIYLGPLATNATDQSNDDARLALGMRKTLRAAAARMLGESGTLDLPWGVLSRGDYKTKAGPRDADGNLIGDGSPSSFAQITDGWVDDALDTQRSRGLVPIVRQTWNAATDA